MRVTVLGSGAWGTALALLLSDNGHQVTLWSYLPEEAEALRMTRESLKFPGVRLPEGIDFTDSFESLPESELVVYPAPSSFMREMAGRTAPYLKPGTLLVSVTKGIEPETGCRMTEIIAQETGFENVCALSGPSHAEEVGRRIPTGVVAACRDPEIAAQVQDIFMNPRFRVYTNEDVVGVELGGALKNVLALCCGICDGMKLGDNTKALLMTRGMTEMARLGVAMGGRKETFAGLAGMGDLIVTCTSMHSRNRRCGILIGQGVEPQEAMRQVGATVEGYYAALSGKQLAEKAGVEMPICETAYRVLYEGQPVDAVVEGLMSRRKRREADESWL